MFRKLREPEGPPITIEIDGVSTVAEQGETIAAVLLREPEAWSRVSPMSERRRAPYCMMGVCFECVAEVDGIGSVQTCLKVVCDGMRVVRRPETREIGY